MISCQNEWSKGAITEVCDTYIYGDEKGISLRLKIGLLLFYLMYVDVQFFEILNFLDQILWNT